MFPSRESEGTLLGGGDVSCGLKNEKAFTGLKSRGDSDIKGRGRASVSWGGTCAEQTHSRVRPEGQASGQVRPGLGPSRGSTASAPSFFRQL